jgi:hypothetical protein
MTNITQPAAATYGGGAVGKVLGRLGCGGDMHYDNPSQFGPPVTLEIKVGDEVALKVPITGFDLLRQQAGVHGTRIQLFANEPG